MQFLMPLIGLFTGKHKALVYGAIGLISVGLFAWWSISTINSLKEEKAQIALKNENANLKGTVEAQQQEMQDFKDKVDGISASITTLNKRYAANSNQRQSDVNSMTGRVERDNKGEINTQALETKANEGMNSLFDDLETLSKNDSK